MASPLLLALAVSVLLGGGATAYLWQVQRRKFERAAGLKIIAGMRWREFSRLVIDALVQRGFQVDTQKNQAERGQQADITLFKDDQPWLLACKQGADYQITPTVVSKFSNAVHFHQAAGGTMATPGRVTGEARSQAGNIELIDGHALWPMLESLLPDSVGSAIAADARTLTVRYLILGWIAALAVGLCLAWLLPAVPQRVVIPVTASANPGIGDTDTDIAPLASAPLTEHEQRELIRRDVSDLQDIDRAVWATRSTLVVYLGNDITQDPLQSICAIVERYDALRASRLQLQAAPGSETPVRFLQCRLF